MSTLTEILLFVLTTWHVCHVIVPGRKVTRSGRWMANERKEGDTQSQCYLL